MAKKKAITATVKAVAIIGYGVNVKLAQGLNQSIAEWPKLETDVRRTYEELTSFAVENPDAGIQKLHQKFLDLLKAKGWKHGEHIDVKRKIHPLMRTFDALHPAERSFYKALEVLAKGVVQHNIIVLDADADGVVDALEEKDAKLKELEDAIVELKSENANLKTDIEVLKAEKTSIQQDLDAAIRGSERTHTGTGDDDGGEGADDSGKTDEGDGGK